MITMTDEKAAWVLARLVAGDSVDEEYLQALDGIEPWANLVQGVQHANGRGRINVLRELCASMPNGTEIEKLILKQNPRKEPRKRLLPGLIPALPQAARLDPDLGAGAGAWLDEYIGYAKKVSPLTPTLFHEAGGLWLVSLAVARRLVLRLGHGDIYPNLAVLQIAPTTLYAKSTGLGVPRHLVRLAMPYLLLPGEMTPEAMLEELGGKTPMMLDGLNMEEWQKGQAFAAQRGICLDEASSLFVGMSKDYNIGMGETLLKLYDCDPHIARQTRGAGRTTVRNAYFSFLGATTPWHLKKADIETLWHTGLWPRFLLMTPDGPPTWTRPSKTRTDCPPNVYQRLARLCNDELPESTFQNPAVPISVGLGDGVFDAFEHYLKAMMHDMLKPPSAIDIRLWGVYGRLPEQSLKIGMLLAALDWDGNGVPVITMKHWARAQAFVEICRTSAHRLPGMLAQQTQNATEEKVIAWLGDSEDEWNTSRDLYRALNMKSSEIGSILNDLEQSGLIRSRQDGRKIFYQLNREAELS